MNSDDVRRVIESLRAFGYFEQATKDGDAFITEQVCAVLEMPL